MYILNKQFIDKLNKLYTKTINNNIIDDDESNELVKIFEEYEKNKKK